MSPPAGQSFASNDPPLRRLHPGTLSPAALPTRADESSIGFDTSRFPLVVIELCTSPTLEAHRKMFDACNRLAARGQRFGYLIDMRKVNPFSLNAALRKEAAAMYKEHLDMRRGMTICEARVIEHPLIRGVAVAFDWIVGHHWPTATFGSVEHAEDWALGRIRHDKKR